jgi:hypothetical protein
MRPSGSIRNENRRANATYWSPAARATPYARPTEPSVSDRRRKPKR